LRGFRIRWGGVAWQPSVARAAPSQDGLASVAVGSPCGLAKGYALAGSAKGCALTGSAKGSGCALAKGCALAGSQRLALRVRKRLALTGSQGARPGGARGSPCGSQRLALAGLQRLALRARKRLALAGSQRLALRARKRLALAGLQRLALRARKRLALAGLQRLALRARNGSPCGRANGSPWRACNGSPWRACNGSPWRARKRLAPAEVLCQLAVAGPRTGTPRRRACDPAGPLADGLRRWQGHALCPGMWPGSSDTGWLTCYLATGAARALASVASPLRRAQPEPFLRTKVSPCDGHTPSPSCERSEPLRRAQPEPFANEVSLLRGRSPSPLRT
jgi:hypothetical protein